MRLATLLLALAAAASGQDVCRTGDRDPYVLFGTKTVYNLANKFISQRPQDVQGCQAEAIWLLNRPGAHNPEADELADLEKLVDTKNVVINNYLQGNFEPRICPSDLALLKAWSWQPRQNSTFAGYLTSSGYMATQHHGHTWRERYPGLFTSNKYDYHFNYGKDQRSAESFRAFTDGLFGAQAESIDVPREHDEKLLMPFKSCPKWTRDVELNNDTLKEVETFESTQEFGEMIANVSRRLGFSTSLDRSVVRRVYQMCRYNKAWAIGHVSPWCTVFSNEDLRRFEYSEDLETFHKYGYGANTELSAGVGCGLLKNMADFLAKHVEQEQPQQPRVSVQFAEAPALLSLLTAMGERRDERLTGRGYHSAAARDRQWTTSNIVPYNANLAAVLYKCNLNGNFGVKERYQVLFLLNEQTLKKVKNCKDGLCPWSDVKSRFSPESCKNVCDGATGLNSVVALSIALLGFFFRFLM